MGSFLKEKFFPTKKPARSVILIPTIFVSLPGMGNHAVYGVVPYLTQNFMPEHKQNTDVQH